MKICLISPATNDLYNGNRATTDRWFGILNQSAHQVIVAQEYDGQACNVMIALHAWRSAKSIREFKIHQPQSALVVAMTGTDLYDHIHVHTEARRSLDLADRLVLLQSEGISELPDSVRHKVRVIYQSATANVAKVRKPTEWFDVCVIGHMRDVKDPFRAAAAARLLPAASRVRILHVGKALDEEMSDRAQREMRENRRYHWLGEKGSTECRSVLASSRALVLSSKAEGGANVISESIVSGVPVIASRISGTVGLLGNDYPGMYPVGDGRALCDLLNRAENDTDFLHDLARRCAERKALFDPAVEAEAWQELLAELAPVPHYN